jgi:hypothetical protein
MKKSELKQLIKEEIQNEIQTKRPGYVVKSPEYKKFHRFIELSEYWGTANDINDNGDVFFNPLNDFYFFYMLWNNALTKNWTPEYCLITNDEFEEMVHDNYELEDDEIEQVKAKFIEHSK